MTFVSDSFLDQTPRQSRHDHQARKNCPLIFTTRCVYVFVKEFEEGPSLTRLMFEDIALTSTGFLFVHLLELLEQRPHAPHA